MFTDLPEGQTHFQNDGCGEKAHSMKSEQELTFRNDIEVHFSGLLITKIVEGKPSTAGIRGRKRAIIEPAIAEAIDQVEYLITLKLQIEEAGIELRNRRMMIEEKIAARIELQRRWIAGESVQFPVHAEPENDVKRRPFNNTKFPFRCKCGANSQTKICSRCKQTPIKSLLY